MNAEPAKRDKIVAAFCQGLFSPHSGSPWNIPIKGHVNRYPVQIIEVTP
jgi:hypothetical protein